MASLHFPITTLPFLIHILLHCSSALAQDIDECGPRLVQLATCAPFIQGSAPSPAQSCCDNLVDLYDEQPTCLCILLNETSVTAFPINRTLALELPGLCNIAPSISDCPGLNLRPGSPESQIFKGAEGNNSSHTASPPPPTLTPRTNLGAGVGRKTSAAAAATKLINFEQFIIASLMVALLTNTYFAM